jgi:hypothetical protein
MIMRERIQAYLEEGKKIIPDWREFVTTKSHPLEWRWEAYWIAPKEWRKNVSAGGLPVAAISHIFDSPYDHFHMELESTKSLKSAMEDVEEKLEEGDEQFAELTQELINQAKEEIMAKNLGDWKYDQ